MLQSGKYAGLANNTKWNALISEIRSWEDWRPSYRTKCINGYISDWDVEWFYHLPFPFKYTLWFDISCQKSHEENKSNELQLLVKTIGFDYKINQDLIRIFGCAPRDFEGFNNS
ncbi:MAG: hypothetical protein COA78_30640 [Blastopirellula sp.]|nr:MAG: hypothetical protein COA78_30640 [Blastopirellula sp.]